MSLQPLAWFATEHKLSYDQLRRDCRARKLPHWEIGGVLLVDPGELFAHCRVEPTKPEVTSGSEPKTAKKQVKLTSSTK